MPAAILDAPFFLLALRSWWEIPVVVAGLILWALIATFWEKWRVHRSRNWPTAQGVLSNVRSKPVDGGANGVDYYKIKFDYTYTVTQAHTGSYSFNCVKEAQANGAVTYLRDKTVTVRYAPGNEAKSLLWEDDVWNLWYDDYWNSCQTAPADQT